MKKLSLKNLNLNHDDLLQREQLKSIFGGYGGGGGDRQPCRVGDNSCTAPNYCIVSSYANYPNGYCGIIY